MKLRNKKTGEIVDFETGIYADTEDRTYEFSSIADLNEHLEDAPEEPKEYWWISPVDTDIVHCVEDAKDEVDQYNKQIGNYFNTREEAELAVEKLKAWKRLRDKGFRFNNFVRDAIYYEISDEEIEKDAVRKDLDLLFGGEE